MIYHTKSSQKKARMAIIISEKVDFKAKTISMDKERSFYNIKVVRTSRGHNNSKHVSA